MTECVEVRAGVHVELDPLLRPPDAVGGAGVLALVFLAGPRQMSQADEVGGEVDRVRGRLPGDREAQVVDAARRGQLHGPHDQGLGDLVRGAGLSSGPHGLAGTGLSMLLCPPLSGLGGISAPSGGPGRAVRLSRGSLPL